MCSGDPVKMTPAWSYEWQELEGYLGALEMHSRKRKHSSTSCSYLLSPCTLSNVMKIRERWGISHEMRNVPTPSSYTWRRKPSIGAVSEPNPLRSEVDSSILLIFCTGRNSETLCDRKSLWIFHFQRKRLKKGSSLCRIWAFHPLKAQA